MSLAAALRSRLRAPIASVALIVSLASLQGCGGSEAAPGDSLASATPSDAPAQEASSASGAAPAPAPGAGAIAGSPAPIVGSIIEVQLIGDARGYRFEPAQITARPGDAVKFVVMSGGPHEISFDLAAVPEASRQQLQFNMPNSTDGRSPLLVAPQEAYTVSLGGLAPGSYPFVSTPRLPQGMKGEIRIQ